MLDKIENKDHAIDLDSVFDESTGTTEYTFTVKVKDGIPQLNELRLSMLVETIRTLSTFEDLDPSLAGKIHAEIFDPKFVTLVHYSTHSLARGCRGPLCNLRTNHSARLIRMRKAYKEGNLELFINRSRWGVNSQQFTIKEQRLNRLVLTMLENQQRRIPSYLQMLLIDPKFDRPKLWEQFLSLPPDRPTMRADVLDLIAAQYGPEAVVGIESVFAVPESESESESLPESWSA